MIPNHRFVDLTIGVSVIGWAVAGITTQAGNRPLSVLIGTGVLHLAVGFLFITRSRQARQGDLRSCLIAIPAVLVGGWVFSLAPSQWNVPSQILFTIGSLFAVVSLLYLGRCFAVLPAVRGTVTRGPFVLVRHPAYLGELVMVLGCLTALPVPWQQGAVLVVALGLFVARIRAEERLLMTEETYRNYCQRVRWRLVPFIW